MKLGKYILLITTLHLLVSCTPKKVKTNFYHWSQKAAISNERSKTLDSLNSDKLYVRFFDVDIKGGKPYPVSLLSGDLSEVKQKIVPCIFIVNNTLKDLNESDITNLSRKIIKLINRICKEVNAGEINEVQIDCDWTLSTKSNYFNLLNQLKSLYKVPVSATIRLHQIKFRDKTGVPPVDKGVLMYYNMGNLNDVYETNTILNNNIGRQYIKQLKNYPLKIDIALPLYSWGVLIRNGKTIKLINNILESDLYESGFIQVKENLWKSDSNFYFKGFYIYRSDKIRLEKVSLHELEKSSKLISEYFNQREFEIIYYHINSRVSKCTNYEDFKIIENIFINN